MRHETYKMRKNHAFRQCLNAHNFTVMLYGYTTPAKNKLEYIFTCYGYFKQNVYSTTRLIITTIPSPFPSYILCGYIRAHKAYAIFDRTLFRLIEKHTTPQSNIDFMQNLRKYVTLGILFSTSSSSCIRYARHDFLWCLLSYQLISRFCIQMYAVDFKQNGRIENRIKFHICCCKGINKKTKKYYYLKSSDYLWKIKYIPYIYWSLPPTQWLNAKYCIYEEFVLCTKFKCFTLLHASHETQTGLTRHIDMPCAPCPSYRDSFRVTWRLCHHFTTGVSALLHWHSIARVSSCTKKSSRNSTRSSVPQHLCEQATRTGWHLCTPMFAHTDLHHIHIFDDKRHATRTPNERRTIQSNITVSLVRGNMFIEAFRTGVRSATINVECLSRRRWRQNHATPV